MVTQSDAPPAVRREEKTPPVRRASLVAWVCLFIVWVVWGSTYLAIRVGIETMPPLLMAAARNLVAGIIMFPAAMGGRRKAIRAGQAMSRWPSRAEWGGCAIVGILLLLANGAVGIGEQTVATGLAALLVATVPLWLLGLDAMLNHARLGLAPLAGLARPARPWPAGWNCSAAARPCWPWVRAPGSSARCTWPRSRSGPGSPSAT
jgi:EamA-like transporter family